MQNLIIGKISSFSVLVSSISLALYADLEFYTILNIGFCCVWSFVFPIIMGFFVKSLKSPAIILSGLIAFSSSIYYEVIPC